MKYKIIYNYGPDGWSFEKEEWETVEQAVKIAISKNRSVPFLIVKVIEWEAKEL